MTAITLQAHYDGKRIVLDEPFELPADVPLMVTVPSSSMEAEFHSEEAWLQAVASNGAFAFLADPAEDIYTVEDGEPFRDAV